MNEIAEVEENSSCCFTINIKGVIARPQILLVLWYLEAVRTF